MFSAPHSWAENFAFEACRGGSTIAPDRRTQTFAKVLETEFLKVSEKSNLEIEESLRCLQQPGAPDCGDRLEYFEKVLPVEWSLYRQKLALSRFSANYILTGEGESEGKVAFNHELSGSKLLWFAGAGDIEGLTASEITKVSKDWETQLRRIRLALRKGIETKIADDLAKRRNLWTHGQMQEALKLMDQPNLSLLIRLQNPYLQDYFSHIQSMVFKLNQKRLISQLGAHPLLGLLSKATLDKNEIVRALGLLQENLRLVEAEFKDFTGRGLNPQPRVSRAGIRGQLDFLGVTESALVEYPEFCGIAGELMDEKIRIEFGKNIAVLAGTGVLFFTAPVIATTGFAVIQSYTLSNAALTAQSSARKAFSSPAPGQNFSSVQQAYLNDSDLGTEMILSPLMLSGISIFKFSKLRGFLVP